MTRGKLIYFNFIFDHIMLLLYLKYTLRLLSSFIADIEMAPQRRLRHHSFTIMSMEPI